MALHSVVKLTISYDLKYLAVEAHFIIDNSYCINKMQVSYKLHFSKDRRLQKAQRNPPFKIFLGTPPPPPRRLWACTPLPIRQQELKEEYSPFLCLPAPVKSNIRLKTQKLATICQKKAATDKSFWQQANTILPIRHKAYICSHFIFPGKSGQHQQL